jgi:hypothetical protein
MLKLISLVMAWQPVPLVMAWPEVPPPTQANFL